MYNAANRKDVRRLEKQAKLDERARQETIRGLMGTTFGRSWVYERLTLCHVFASSFSLSPYEAAFREGERNVGLQILTDVMQCPDEYVLMMREANVRAATAERASSEDGDGRDQERDPAAHEPAYGESDSELEAG